MNRVWIELERPTSNEEGHIRAELATRMIARLGVDFGPGRSTVWWNERRQRYCFTLDASGTFVEAGDNGHWYNLDFFGRATEPTTSARMPCFPCPEPTLPDEAVGREHQ